MTFFFEIAGPIQFVNTFLHLFGWAIVLHFDEYAEGEPARLVHVSVARTKFRGFSAEMNDKMYVKLTRHVAENAPQLLADVEGESPEPRIVSGVHYKNKE